MEIVYYTNQSYLEHHGIKGQHWGVRRYQNKDGTLTELGKKKYGSVDNFNKVRKDKRARNMAIAKRVAKATITTAAVAAGTMAVKSVLASAGAFALPHASQDLGLTFPGTSSSYGPRPHAVGKNRNSLLNTLMGYFAETGQISPGTSGDMFNQMLFSKPHHASISNVVINRRGR